MDLANLSAKNTTYHDSWLDKPVFSWWQALTVEKLLIVIILVLTIFTRFYELGARTMSHDEINHVVPAYNFGNYVYDPVTYGPFQFHALAFSYFMFGDSDFSARIPAAIFGIAIVAFAIFAWRRYLGRLGGLIVGLLFMISETQLISSKKRIPCLSPVFSMVSYTVAIISLMVYSETSYSTPPKFLRMMKGRPSALCRVW